jgi:fructokinase
MTPLWGIDLGGTKIEGAIVESLNPVKIATRLRLPTEKEKGYEHIINQIANVVELLKKESGLSPEKLGIGTPGTLDPATGLLKNSNTTVLNGRPVHLDLGKKLGIPVAIANDANCFAVAEARLGAVAKKLPEAKVVFGVIMGTGVGGGLVIDGKVRNGLHGIAGEWGHNFLDYSGGNCYCGKIGCVERLISGSALEQYYAEMSRNALKLSEIYERAKGGMDDYAMMTIERLLEFFGKSMAMVINTLDPDAIILGGGVGNIDHLYTEGVERVKKYVFNNDLRTPFFKPELGDSAGVFGAALL